jgi:hypothetical protein
LREKIETQGATYTLYSYPGAGEGAEKSSKIELSVLLLPWLLEQMGVLQPDVIVYDMFAIWGRFLETLLPHIPAVNLLIMCTYLIY